MLVMTEEHSIPTQNQLIRNGLPCLRLRQSLHFVRHLHQRQAGCSVLQQGTIEHQLSKPPSRYLFSIPPFLSALGNFT